MEINPILFFPIALSLRRLSAGGEETNSGRLLGLWCCPPLDFFNLSHFDIFSRVSANDGPRFNVFDGYGAGADYGSFANGYSLPNEGFGTDPCSVGYDD